jgi:ABC-type metal ion transport system substrate-binding protein
MDLNELASRFSEMCDTDQKELMIAGLIIQGKLAETIATMEDLTPEDYKEQITALGCTQLIHALSLLDMNAIDTNRAVNALLEADEFAEEPMKSVFDKNDYK